MTTTLKAKIRNVPDFPKPGILFYDITTLLRDPDGFRDVIGALTAPFVDKGIDLVVGIESRGFILGGAVADRLGAGFVPVRKPGKLPAATARESYSLEVHEDAVTKGQNVLIVDDVIATGGTAKATAALVRRLGGHVHALAFLIELEFLNGRKQLTGERIFSVLQY